MVTLGTELTKISLGSVHTEVPHSSLAQAAATTQQNAQMHLENIHTALGSMMGSMVGASSSSGQMLLQAATTALENAFTMHSIHHERVAISQSKALISRMLHDTQVLSLKVAQDAARASNTYRKIMGDEQSQPSHVPIDLTRSAPEPKLNTIKKSDQPWPGTSAPLVQTTLTQAQRAYKAKNLAQARAKTATRLKRLTLQQHLNEEIHSSRKTSPVSSSQIPLSGNSSTEDDDSPSQHRYDTRSTPSRKKSPLF